MTRRKRLRFQNRVLVLVLLTVAPAWVATVILLTVSDATPPLRYTIVGFLSLGVLIGLVAVRRHVVRPLQTLANMLEALREGDYSMRGRNVDPEDAFGEVMVEVNTLSRTLYDQRLEALEAGALLQKNHRRRRHRRVRVRYGVALAHRQQGGRELARRPE